MTTDAVTELGLAPLLPRLPEGAQAGVHRLYERAPPWSVAIGPWQGRLRFAWSEAPAHGVEPHGLQRFRLGPHAGTLGVDSVGLAALTGEPRVDLLPRELRTILLAEALQGLAAQVQTASRLRFDWLADEPPRIDAQPEPVAAFALHDEQGSPLAHGFVAFDDPRAFDAVVPAFDPLPRPALPAALLRLLVLPLRFEIGRTAIRWQELRGVGRGDIVGIERWRAAGTGLQLAARLGALELDAVAEGNRLTLHMIGETTMSAPADVARSPADDGAGLPLDRLDAMEVDLRFELGALSLSLGELRALKPGHVFDLAEPLNRSTVRIVAHGNLLGKGHLVAVGDRLGVRVAEFAASAL